VTFRKRVSPPNKKEQRELKKEKRRSDFAGVVLFWISSKAPRKVTWLMRHVTIMVTFGLTFVTFPCNTQYNAMAQQALDAELVFDVQPNYQAVVWQHNGITNTRYKLTARQQKLLLYAIAMIEPNAAEFGKIRVSVEDYAALTGLETDNLYRELRETALAIREAPLVVDHVEPGMKKPMRRHSAWFEYVDEADGSGFVTIKLTSWLKPYLLQVRREFFQFQLGFALDLKSEYSIRLYQYLKRWEFAKRRTITVDQLRLEIGATEIDRKGNIVRVNLEQYKHFKSRAINTAIEEINRETDLSVSYTESTFPGRKAVQSLTFTINKNLENLDKLRPVTLPDQAQLEFPGAQTDPGLEAATLDALAEIAKEFGLTRTQELGLRAYAVREGLQYLLDKAQIVRSQPRTNAARAFLAALRDDWKPAKPLPPKKAPKPKLKQALREPPGWRDWVRKYYPTADVDSFSELQRLVPDIASQCAEDLKKLSADNSNSLKQLPESVQAWPSLKEMVESALYPSR
jgi:plasmid replication initiation protein